MKLIIVLLLVIGSTGCFSYSRVSPDGERVAVNSLFLRKNLEGLKAQTSGRESTHSIEIEKATSDASKELNKILQTLEEAARDAQAP